MNTTKAYINEWQQALQLEIQNLKKFGGSQYSVSNGRLLSNDDLYNYYFDTAISLRIPVGSSIKFNFHQWGFSFIPLEWLVELIGLLRTVDLPLIFFIFSES
jgi:hypothetical protein